MRSSSNDASLTSAHAPSHDAHSLLPFRTRLCIALQVTTPHFDHQAWVQSVAAASSLSTLRSNLAQLEDALTHEGQGLEKGKKTRGQAKAESERIPLLSPAWHVLSGTPCVKGAWLGCGAEVPAAAIGADGLLQPVPLVQPAAAAAAAVLGAPDGAADAAAGGELAAVSHEQQQQQQEAEAVAQQRQQQQRQEALASLAWLPATAAALSLRVAALDAVLQYPQLGPQRAQLTGRECLARYR